MNNIVRNIVVVGLFAAGGGWLGMGLNGITGNTMAPIQSVGALVWLVSPAVAGMLLRIFGGDGWSDAGLKPHFVAHWKWYLLAVLVYPVAALFSLGVALPLDAISVEGFATRGYGAYLAAVSIVLAGSVVKNIFEELAWRGYLTPRLDASNVHPLLNHLIVGILWWSWHLPYYCYFLDEATLNSYLSTSVPVFLLTAVIGLFPTAILFGELRLISQSVWPVFILHNAINALSMPLIIHGFIKPHGTLGTIFTPTNEGLFTSFLLGVAGLLICRYRMRTQVGLTYNKERTF